jgi:hypothetical protein
VIRPAVQRPAVLLDRPATMERVSSLKGV